MIQQRIPKEFIDFISEEMFKHFDSTILKRGFTYYKEGHVLDVQVERGSLIQATVRGTTTYHVTIDPDFFTMSTCTCPYDGFCKHIAATFFTIYAQYDSPKQWMNDYKNRHSPGPSPKRNVITSFEPNNPHIPLQKTNRFETIQTANENDSVFKWHQIFQRNYDKDYKIHSSYDIHSLFDRISRELLAISKKWAIEKQFLYELHVQLFLINQVVKLWNSRNTSYYAWYFESEWRDILEMHVSTLLQLLQSQTAQHFQVRTEDSYIQDTVKYLHFILEKQEIGTESRAIDWLLIYRSVWMCVLGKNPALVQTEMNYLERQLPKTKNDIDKQESVTLALAFFDTFLGNDSRAMERLSHLPFLSLDAFIFNLVYHEQGERWDKLLQWLRWFQQSVKTDDHEILFILSRFWRKVSEYIQSDAEWINVLKAYLPGSLSFYADYMIDTNRFQEWVNALLLYQIPLENVPKEHLKKVEKNDILLLLPLYHHAVERLVQEKNRQSYKQAVRHLKTLRRYYKKSKQMDRWHMYFHAFSKKYSRLRALHEELKKGKLEE